MCIGWGEQAWTDIVSASKNRRAAGRETVKHSVLEIRCHVYLEWQVGKISERWEVLVHAAQRFCE